MLQESECMQSTNEQIMFWSLICWSKRLPKDTEHRKQKGNSMEKQLPNLDIELSMLKDKEEENIKKTITDL